MDRYPVPLPTFRKDWPGCRSRLETTGDRSASRGLEGMHCSASQIQGLYNSVARCPVYWQDVESIFNGEGYLSPVP